MKEIFETGRPSARDTDQPSPMRRKILKACAYLPTAPLLAMLGGCDGDGSALVGDTSTFTPEQLKAIETEVTKRLNLRIPPFKTTDNVSMPKLDAVTTGRSMSPMFRRMRLPLPNRRKWVFTACNTIRSLKFRRASSCPWEGLDQSRWPIQTTSRQ